MQIKNLKENKKNIQHTSDYISNHFGFDFIDIDKKTFSKKLPIEEEKIKVLKLIDKQNNDKTKPTGKMFFYKKSVLARNKQYNSSLGLDIVKLESAIGEATLIKTAISILEAEGYSNFQVSVNAIGSKDSLKLWKTELTKHYKNFKNDLKLVEQKKISKDPEDIFFTKKDYLKDINGTAPTPLEFLSEKNIEHFQDLIKYLENFKINYIVDERMIGEKQIFSKTIFKIFAKSSKTKEVEEVAFGGRYDELAAKAVHKRKFSAIGLTLNFLKKNKTKLKLKELKINIHLLKIGSVAKLKYLDIVDTLSKLKVPVQFDISEEKISNQIKTAVADKADYTIIIGEAEAKQDKVLVRRMRDYSQAEVDMDKIGTYIKKLL